MKTVIMLNKGEGFILKISTVNISELDFGSQVQILPLLQWNFNMSLKFFVAFRKILFFCGSMYSRTFEVLKSDELVVIFQYLQIFCFARKQSSHCICPFILPLFDFLF